MGQGVLESLIRFFYPGACPACLQASEDDGLCGACARQVPFAAAPDRPSALASRPVLVACRYSGVVRDLILGMKFGRDPHPATALGVILAEVLGSSGFARDADSVVAMPLSRRRLRERGFNQAERIAAVVAGRLRLPVLGKALRRAVHRPPQADLGLLERARNVRGVFRAGEGVFGRAILLLDDVITTGHTAAEAAATLEAAGARLVLCAAVAQSVRSAPAAPGTG